MKPLVTASLPLIFDTAKRHIGKNILEDVATAMEIPLEALTNAQHEQLLYFAAFSGTILGDSGHRQAQRKLDRELKAYDFSRAALASFHDSEFDFIKYTIDLNSGWHGACAASGAWDFGSESLTVMSTEVRCERDLDYCCERCDGPRKFTSDEREATGFYGGWYVGTEEFYGSEVVALGRVPTEFVHILMKPEEVPLLGRTSAERFRSFLLPWTVAI